MMSLSREAGQSFWTFVVTLPPHSFLADHHTGGAPGDASVKPGMTLYALLEMTSIQIAGSQGGDGHCVDIKDH